MNDPYKPPQKSFLYYSLIAVLVLMLLNAFVFPSMMSPRLEEVSYDPVSYTHLDVKGLYDQ